MPANEIFESCVRPAEDLAGVFEYDGEVGFFYLYDIREAANKKIRAAIRILVGPADFEESDISVCWDLKEQFVALFIRDHIWAAFDSQTAAKYGGNYSVNRQAQIPENVRVAFLNQ